MVHIQSPIALKQFNVVNYSRSVVLTLFCNGTLLHEDLFFVEIDHLSTCNFVTYSQDWQLCSEFTAEFFTNAALRNP